MTKYKKIIAGGILGGHRITLLHSNWVIVVFKEKHLIEKKLADYGLLWKNIFSFVYSCMLLDDASTFVFIEKS